MPHPEVELGCPLDVESRIQLRTVQAVVARPAVSLEICHTGEVPVERERITVRLVAADLIVQYAWTREGEMVLVPHYRFRDADGGEWWVLAIADRYLEG
jgi:hypothetical protein